MQRYRHVRKGVGIEKHWPPIVAGSIANRYHHIMRSVKIQQDIAGWHIGQISCYRAQRVAVE